jgi:hypothetical protein
VPKWKKDAKEFPVKVRYDGNGTGIAVYLPKPVAEFLGNPPMITFVKKGKRLEVRAGGETA